MNSDPHIYIRPLASPGREAERAAVAALVAEVFGDGIILRHRADGSPYVAIDGVHISVSHCRTCAVLAVADRPVGVDVETDRPQLIRVAPRVMSPGEMECYSGRLVEAWTLKEALYKAALTPGVDFRSDIHLPLDGGRCATVYDRPFTIVRSEWLYAHSAWLSVVI